jgi:hypothetical protein
MADTTKNCAAKLRRDGRKLHHVHKIDLVKRLFRARLPHGSPQAAVHVVGNQAQALRFELTQVSDYLRELGVLHFDRAAAHYYHFSVALRGEEHGQ